MKHNVSVTTIIITVFLITQIFGLALVKESITVEEINGEIVIKNSVTRIDKTDKTTGLYGFIYILIAVGIGTTLVLLIIKYGKMNIWKTWFFLAVFLAISFSLEAVFQSFIAYIIAFLLAIAKITRKNVFVHNVTEVLMYSGIAIIIVDMFNVFWVSMLLIAISVYDMYAVWKSKHMIKMAKFQAKSQLFAGLMIPYERNKIKAKIPKKAFLEPKKKKIKNAILGGGDVVFPLIFSGTVMESLILKGISIQTAFLQASIIGVTTTIAISSLFIFAKKNKFYPAMPIVSAGCFIGLLLVFLL